MIIGDTNIFAIETKIKQVYPLPENLMTQQALGCFLVHVCDRSYGVEKEDATMLGFIAASVQKRIEDRRLQERSLSALKNIPNLADALVAATLHADAKISFDGLSGAEIYKIINDNDIDWAPGLDEAFDDGYHLFQLNFEDEVRLIGCKILDDFRYNHLSDITMSSNKFYAILSEWHASYSARVDDMLNDANIKNSIERS
jgi:Immunity protein 42